MPDGLARRLVAQLTFYVVNTLGAYVSLNLMLVLVRPFVGDWSIWEATALTVPPMALAMIHLVVPLAMWAKTRLRRRGEG